MAAIDKMKIDGTWDTLNKREKLFKTRQREKLEKTFGSIADMTRQPAAIFIIDILKEHIALAEAKKLNIPTFAMVDTNSNPKFVDFPIPANDDATKSITIILDQICGAIKEGLEERKNAKSADKEGAEVTNETAEVTNETTEVINETTEATNETAEVANETTEVVNETTEVTNTESSATPETTSEN